MAETKTQEQSLQKVKFTDEEVKRLKTIRDNFSDISFKLGQLEISKLSLAEQKLGLENEYKSAQEKERALADELLKKYGRGTIDIDSGEFIPVR